MQTFKGLYTTFNRVRSPLLTVSRLIISHSATEMFH